MSLQLHSKWKIIPYEYLSFWMDYPSFNLRATAVEAIRETAPVEQFLSVTTLNHYSIPFYAECC
jgi:hypothetical protein